MSVFVKEIKFQETNKKERSGHYMDQIISVLGYHDLIEYIPFTLAELIPAYKADRDFATLDTRSWMMAAALSIKLYSQKLGISDVPIKTADKVLKECARRFVENEMESHRDGNNISREAVVQALQRFYRAGSEDMDSMLLCLGSMLLHIPAAQVRDMLE